MASFLILNGPNINMLGRRDASLYGSKTLEEVNQEISRKANDLGVEVFFYQSNVEGELINCIQEHWGKIQGHVWFVGNPESHQSPIQTVCEMLSAFNSNGVGHSHSQRAFVLTTPNVASSKTMHH